MLLLWITYTTVQAWWSDYANILFLAQNLYLSLNP